MDRDTVLADHILEYDHASAHLGNLEYLDLPLSNTKRYVDSPLGSISLIMCPAWGTIFPPYNLSRLSSVLRENRYNVNIFDLNVKCYNFLRTYEEPEVETVDTIEQRGTYWESVHCHLWIGEQYYKYLHPKLQSILDKGIQEILNTGDDIIGFSLYETNYKCSEYVIKKLKEFNPNLIIVIGGPETIIRYHDKTIINILNSDIGDYLDYIVIGEGEDHILEIMKNYKNNYSDMKIMGDLFSKINLDDLPFPDYSDYDFNDYRHKSGVSLETSRGCVASCTFCSETLFWKFRHRGGSRLLDEVKYQIKEYGVDRFWFIDSLVNGDLNKFYDFISGVVEQDLKILWNGYARCDGRMDKEFIKLIKDSGCTALSFGVESGSPLVLLDMKKNISPIEIIKNLKHTHEVELYSHVNWIVGYSTETITDSYHSLILLFICREWIHNISPGLGLGIGTLTDMYTNAYKYNIAETRLFNTWHSMDFKNTDLNRIMRVLYTTIVLKLFNIRNSQDRSEFLDKHVDFKPKNKKYNVKYLNQDYIDFEIFKPKNTSLESILLTTLGNEFIMLAYFLYKIYGDFKLNIKFTNDELVEEFGERGKYYSTDTKIKVNGDTIEYDISQEILFDDEDVRMFGVPHKIKENYKGITDLNFKTCDVRLHVNYEHKVPKYLDFGDIDFENL
jgi:hypothetical protein